MSHDLHDKHLTYACREFLDGKQRLGLPVDRIPQLDEVTATLRPLSGFSYLCAPGLVAYASSTAHWPSASSTRPSTSVIRPSRCTRPSPM